VLSIDRHRLLEDALQQLITPGVNLKKPLKVQFKGEPGVDEGGVRKEFFQLLLKELFDPNFAMFNYNEHQRLYWFNGMSMEPNINFELVGVIMGLAIYNHVILDVPFPMVLYKKLVGWHPSIDDLKEWQPEVAMSMEYIKNYNEEAPLEETLGQTFTVEQEQFGEVKSFDLKPDGAHIPVREDNKEEFVELFIDFTFNKQCQN